MPKKDAVELSLGAGVPMSEPADSMPTDISSWVSSPDRDAPILAILNPKSSFKSLLYNAFLSVLSERVKKGASTPLHLWEVETNARVGPLFKDDFRSTLLPEKAKPGEHEAERGGPQETGLFLATFLMRAQTSPSAIEFGSNFAERFWEDRTYCQTIGVLKAMFGEPERFIFLVPVTGEQDVVEGAIAMLSRIARHMPDARVLVFESDFKGAIDEVSPDFVGLYRRQLNNLKNHRIIRVPKLPITLPGGTTGSRIDTMRADPAQYCRADGAIEKLSDRVGRRALSTDQRMALLVSAARVQRMKRWLDEMWKVGEGIADAWDEACLAAGMHRHQEVTVEAVEALDTAETPDVAA